MVRLLRKEKTLGFLSRFREIEVDQEAISALEDVFAEIDVPLRRADRQGSG